jgi:hypothetical protein
MKNKQLIKDAKRNPIRDYRLVEIEKCKQKK